MGKKEEPSHEKEWQKISLEYKNLAKIQDNSDIFYYRHQCIECLINGIGQNEI